MGDLEYILSRNPLDVFRTWDEVDIVGNTAHPTLKERWRYEVPPHRRFYMQLTSCKIARVDSQSLNAERTRVVLQWSKAPFETELDFKEWALAAKVSVGLAGSVLNDHIGPMLFPSGARIICHTQDEDNGKTDWNITMVGIEFDDT